MLWSGQKQAGSVALQVRGRTGQFKVNSGQKLVSSGARKVNDWAGQAREISGDQIRYSQGPKNSLVQSDSVKRIHQLLRGRGETYILHHFITLF